MTLSTIPRFLAVLVVGLAVGAGRAGFADDEKERESRLVGNDQDEGEEPEKKEKPEKAEKPKKSRKADKSDEDGESAPPVEPERPRAAPSKNFDIPQDLPQKLQSELAEAIALFEDAQKTGTGSSKAMKRAVERLKQVSEKLRQSPLPLYYLGLAYQDQRNFSEAKRVLEKAVTLGPNFYEAVTELANVYRWQRDHKGSLGVYEKALTLKPENTLALDGKARALITLGRFKEAQIYLGELVRLEPTEERTRLVKSLDVELKGPRWARAFVRESENFAVHTSVSQELADEVAAHAELIRRVYNRVFASTKIAKPERKYPIWVYENRDAYVKGGGPPWAGGHFDPTMRKLVIFKYTAKAEMYTVIYHEAFHQYLQDYSEGAPQWFNEGLGDYFGGFEYQKRGIEEFMVARPSKNRLRVILYALRAEITPLPSELLTMSRAEMYSGNIGVNYAMAWSLIYFLLEGRNHPYKPILEKYFGAIVQGKNTQEAYDSTFGRIDMTRFTKDWQAFTRNVKITGN